jgi:hypothetical protein
MRTALRLLVVAVIAAVLLPRSGPVAEGALSDAFQHKWPWLPGVGYTITTLPYQENHCCGSTCNNGSPGSCTDAYDFVIANDDVRSSVQGVIAASETEVHECGPNLHYGNYALVQTNYHQVTYVTYAHLETVTQTTGTIYQGDYVGRQGETGNVIPCPGGKHLHFGFDPARPALIDNRATDFTTKNPDPPLTSTNSPAGEDANLTPFPAIRGEYILRGGWTFGWTHDVGRPGLPFPQGLYVHNYRTWGWEQTFANNPYYTGAIELGLYVGAWGQGVSQPIHQYYWPTWNAGGVVPNRSPPVYYAISLPTSDFEDCPPGSASTCAGYQLYHLGYMWNDWSANIHAVWCPDVGIPADPTKDGAVNMQEVVAVLHYVGCEQGGPPNSNGAYYDPWFDMNGDAAVNFQDVVMVLNGVGYSCYPT